MSRNIPVFCRLSTEKRLTVSFLSDAVDFFSHPSPGAGHKGLPDDTFDLFPVTEVAFFPQIYEPVGIPDDPEIVGLHVAGRMMRGNDRAYLGDEELAVAKVGQDGPGHRWPFYFLEV